MTENAPLNSDPSIKIAPDTTSATNAARERVAAVFPRVMADLKELVQIPSVSQLSFDQAQVTASAAWVANKLEALEMDSVRTLKVVNPDGYQGAPAVVASRAARDGAPTVMLYAHHDVQPPGEAADWKTPAFEPTEVDGRLFARGAADDKAGVLAHLTAIELLGADSPLGLVVFIEGEEEIGSPTFQTFLKEHEEALRADVIVVADSSNWKVGVPALTTSLRGMLDAEIEVRVLEHAIHSGMYGGPVLDALTVMARVLATLHDDQGNVAVAGLQQGAEPSVDYPEADFRIDAGTVDGLQLAGSGSVTGRLWVKPALGVIGLDAPAVAVASNTLIPSARAKISMRLAPGQDPDLAMQAFIDHVAAQPAFGARVTVTPGSTGKAFQAPADSVAMKIARDSFEAAWGVPPVDIGVGGSIPFVADLLESFPDASILVTGVEDPDTRAHGANESLHIAEFEKVCLAELLLLEKLSHSPSI